MTQEPIAARVERSARLEQRLAATFAAERSADGSRPARFEFESDYWPVLATELSFAWQYAHIVDPADERVRALVVRPTAVFPPATVVFVVVVQDSETVNLVLDIEFDWGFRWPTEAEGQ